MSELDALRRELEYARMVKPGGQPADPERALLIEAEIARLEGHEDEMQVVVHSPDGDVMETAAFVANETTANAPKKRGRPRKVQ